MMESVGCRCGGVYSGGKAEVIAELDKEGSGDGRIADRIAAGLNETCWARPKRVARMVAARREDGTYLEQKEIRPDGWKVDKR